MNTPPEQPRITPAQVRAARGLLDWTQGQLAEAAEIGLSTLRDFEAGRRAPVRHNLTALRRTLETAGIEFIPENGGGPGVRLRKPAAAPAEPAGAAKPASGGKTAPSKKTGRRRS